MLSALKHGITALVLVAVLIAALAMALDSFQDELGADACYASDATYNSSSRTCYGSATTNGTSHAFNMTEEGLEGSSNASSYLSTIGTLIGVAALIAVVVAAFYFIRR